METTYGTKDVKRPSISKKRTIAVTKAVLRKNRRKQTCKPTPVLRLSNGIAIANK